MRQTITYRCSQCKKSCEMEAREGSFSCPHCAKPGGKVDSLDNLLDQCAICQCRQFYLSKDFNQVLGLLILAVGIVLVPKTYGLSLPLFALVDWVLYKRVPTIVNCYQCGAIFRGLVTPMHLKPFSHPTGLRYDKFRR